MKDGNESYCPTCEGEGEWLDEDEEMRPEEMRYLQAVADGVERLHGAGIAPMTQEALLYGWLGGPCDQFPRVRAEVQVRCTTPGGAS